MDRVWPHRLLGPRLRAFITLGRRAPHVELLDDVFGVRTTTELHATSLHSIAQSLGAVYTNATLKAATVNPVRPLSRRAYLTWQVLSY